jgi:non-specific serine/threonine protein kinase
MARELGDKRSEAWSQMFLSNITDQQDPFVVNWRRSEEALALLRELNDDPGVAQALTIQGELAKLAGDNGLARQKYDAALVVSRGTGETIRQIMLVSNIAMIAYNEGNYREARDLNILVLERFLESGTRQGIISALWALAGPLGLLGQPEKAARLLGASAALFAEMGAGDAPTDYEQVAKYTAEAQAQLGDAAFQAAWNEGQAMTLEQAVAYAQGD